MVKRLTGNFESPPSCLNAISFLAIEAPLVAGFWWLLLAKSFGGTVNWSIFLALLPAVWAIYLFDRIYDATKASGEMPPRKRFAKQHPVVLRSLLGLAVIWTGLASLFLSKEIWIQGAVVGLFTAAYFLICRWKTRATSFPLKESLIGFCFAAGVGLPYELPINGMKIAALVTFGVLGTLNCLMISKAEAHYDEENDLSAWFAKNGRVFPVGAALFGSAIAVLCLWFAGLPTVLAMSLLATTLLLYFADKCRSDLTQPFADAAMWLPGLCGGLFTL